MSVRKKTIEEKENIPLESVQHFRRDFVSQSQIFYNEMSNLKVLCGDQEMIWKTGVCKRPQKQNKRNSIFGSTNFSKIRIYALLNTLSREHNSEMWKSR